MVLAALLSAVLAVALGLFAADRYATRSGPESVARGFFQALADGDAPAALAFAADPPRGPWLTGVVLRQQLLVAPLTDISILRTTRLGATTAVRIDYRLHYASGTRSVSDTVQLVRRGSSWRLSRVAGTVRVTAGSPGADRLRLAGRRLPAAPVTLFPGALPLAADPPALQVLVTGDTSAGDQGAGDQPVVRLTGTPLVARARVSISPALRSQVEQAVDRLLAGCLAARSNDPLCPVPGSGRPIPGTLHGSAPSIGTASPAITLERGSSGLVRVRARLQVQGSWKAWDFENQVVPRRGTATVDVTARLALSRPTEAFWSPS
jgi:hypothetical protein